MSPVDVLTDHLERLTQLEEETVSLDLNLDLKRRCLITHIEDVICHIESKSSNAKFCETELFAIAHRVVKLGEAIAVKVDSDRVLAIVEPITTTWIYPQTDWYSRYSLLEKICSDFTFIISLPKDELNDFIHELFILMSANAALSTSVGDSMRLDRESDIQIALEIIKIKEFDKLLNDTRISINARPTRNNSI